MDARGTHRWVSGTRGCKIKIVMYLLVKVGRLWLRPSFPSFHSTYAVISHNVGRRPYSSASADYCIQQMHCVSFSKGAFTRCDLLRDLLRATSRATCCAICWLQQIARRNIAGSSRSSEVFVRMTCPSVATRRGTLLKTISIQ